MITSIIDYNLAACKGALPVGPSIELYINAQSKNAVGKLQKAQAPKLWKDQANNLLTSTLQFHPKS